MGSAQSHGRGHSVKIDVAFGGDKHKLFMWKLGSYPSAGIVSEMTNLFDKHREDVMSHSISAITIYVLRNPDETQGTDYIEVNETDKFDVNIENIKRLSTHFTNKHDNDPRGYIPPASFVHFNLRFPATLSLYDEMMPYIFAALVCNGFIPWVENQQEPYFESVEKCKLLFALGQAFAKSRIRDGQEQEEEEEEEEGMDVIAGTPRGSPDITRMTAGGGGVQLGTIVYQRPQQPPPPTEKEIIPDSQE